MNLSKLKENVKGKLTIQHTPHKVIHPNIP